MDGDTWQTSGSVHVVFPFIVTMSSVLIVVEGMMAEPEPGLAIAPYRGPDRVRRGRIFRDVPSRRKVHLNADDRLAKNVRNDYFRGRRLVADRGVHAWLGANVTISRVSRSEGDVWR